jgi:anti-anti-sigma factor
MKPQKIGSTRVTNRDGIWVLALDGEHDLATLPMLERRMEQACASATSGVIDLTHATFIDCSVADWLLRWSERANRDHAHLAVAVGETRIVNRVIDLLNVAGSVPCHATKAEARESLKDAANTPTPTTVVSFSGAASSHTDGQVVLI